MDSRPKVVVVGGGFAGLRTVKGLARCPVDITLIDRSNHHLFQPLLYQVATAGLSPADIATPIRSVLNRQKNVSVVMANVIGVDTGKNEVICDDGRFSFDFLVLATGARHGYFGHDDWETHAPGLKSIADALGIRQKILRAFEQAEREADAKERERLLTFVLVGGGPTGVEMAGSIAELAHRALACDFRRIDPHSTKVILVEAGPSILTSFPEELSGAAVQALSELGVEVRTGARVEGISDAGVVVNGRLLPSATVIWAAGVVASPAGKWLNAPTDRAGRVVVQPDLSVAGHPNIFVIGDAAAAVNEKGKPLPGIAPVAMQAGRYVAGAIARGVQGKAAPPPFHYWDKGNLATVGRKFAIADLGTARLKGWIAWMAWIVVHIYYLIGFRNRLLVMIQWAWAYVTFQRGARLITEVKQNE